MLAASFTVDVFIDKLLSTYETQRKRSPVIALCACPPVLLFLLHAIPTAARVGASVCYHVIAA